MRAYTTEHASSLARQSRTLGLGDVNPNDIPENIPLNVPGTFYMQDYAMNMLSPGGSYTSPAPATAMVPASGGNSGLLIGAAILLLVLLSGGHH